MFTSRRQHGFTIIELIVFIVIVSVALTGVLAVLNVTAKSSSDPVIRKQALAIAEAVLEEVMLQAFTWCDPDDPSAATAATSADCTGGAGGANDESRSPLGAEAGETRAPGSTTPLDNVSDYNGLAITTAITGAVMPTGYSAAVTVAEAALNGIAAADSLLVTVTVTSPGETIQLQGYRSRHSPKFLP